MAKTLAVIESSFKDERIQVAHDLIVKGKEQGYLPPDDILDAFPEMKAVPEQVLLVFEAFAEMGIAVTDGEKDIEEIDEADSEMNDSVSMDDPVRMYLKEIGRVSLLTANDEVVLAQAIEAKSLHDAFKALSVAEEVEGRSRSVEETLPDVIERLALIKRKRQQAHIAHELLGLNDLSKLQNLLDAAAADRKRQANGAARPRVRAEALEAYRIARYRLTERYERAYEAKQRLTEANLRLVVSIANDPRGREVRLPQGLQVLDLRNLVDPAGCHPRHRRPGADDSHPGPHGGDHQQACPGFAAHARGSGPGAHRRGDCRGDGPHPRAGARGHQVRAGADLAGDTDRP